MVEQFSMAFFWNWTVRPLFALVVAAMVAAGFTGVLEWTAALPFATFAVLIADTAHHLGARAGERARQRREVMETAKWAEERRKSLIDHEAVAAAAKRAA